MRINWCRLFHIWISIPTGTIHTYQVCARCDKRRVLTANGGGHQPVDYGWVETGKWTKPGKPPTSGGIGISFTSKGGHTHSNAMRRYIHRNKPCP